MKGSECEGQYGCCFKPVHECEGLLARAQVYVSLMSLRVVAVPLSAENQAGSEEMCMPLEGSYGLKAMFGSIALVCGQQMVAN